MDFLLFQWRRTIPINLPPRRGLTLRQPFTATQAVSPLLMATRRSIVGEIHGLPPLLSLQVRPTVSILTTFSRTPLQELSIQPGEFRIRAIRGDSSPEGD